MYLVKDAIYVHIWKAALYIEICNDVEIDQVKF